VIDNFKRISANALIVFCSCFSLFRFEVLDEEPGDDEEGSGQR